MFRPATHPRLPITFNKQFLILGFLGILSAVTILPNSADAFWPFSINADAASNTFVPSSDTPALTAATNIDPDAGVDVPLTTSSDSALVSYSGPSGTLADVGDLPRSDTISVYVVRPGDTLSVIAKMFNVSVNTIIWANNLSGVKDVHTGQTLVILPISGVKRTVIKGDTLKSIAKKYDADAGEIAQFNGLDPAEPLEIGSTLIIPGGEAAPAPVVKKAPSRKIGAEPYLGGGGPSQPGYYSSPAPGARVTQGLHGHNGIDFGVSRGTPIHAAADGTVIIARNSGWNGGYGVYVVITHPNGTQTLYAHLTNSIVSSGQSVTSGQVIGYSGNTGKSTGAHLHFEVRGAANPFAR
jgi:LysM repeat protein